MRTTWPWSTLSRRRSPAPQRAVCRSVAGYELNVSCPNVRTGCLSIGSDQAETAALVTAVRPRHRSPPRGEAHAQRHRRGGRGSRRRGRRCRLCLSGQHVPRDGPGPGHVAAVPRQSHRRLVRPGHQAYRPAHGARRGRGAPGAGDRHGRHRDRSGRARVHRLRRHGRGRGGSQLRRRRRRRAHRRGATGRAARASACPASRRRAAWPCPPRPALPGNV